MMKNLFKFFCFLALLLLSANIFVSATQYGTLSNQVVNLVYGKIHTWVFGEDNTLYYAPNSRTLYISDTPEYDYWRNLQESVKQPARNTFSGEKECDEHAHKLSAKKNIPIEFFTCTSGSALNAFLQDQKKILFK